MFHETLPLYAFSTISHHEYALPNIAALLCMLFCWTNDENLERSGSNSPARSLSQAKIGLPQHLWLQSLSVLM